MVRSAFGALGIIALFAAMALGLLASYGAIGPNKMFASFSGNTPAGSEPSGTSTTKQVDQLEQTAAAIGETVTAGDLAWTVTDARKATEVHKQMPPPPMTKQGNFVTVTFTVKNVSEQPVTLSGGDLTLISEDQHMFPPRSNVNGGYVEDEKNILFNGRSLLQPGDVKEGEANFELPMGVSAPILQIEGTNPNTDNEKYVDLGT